MDERFRHYILDYLHFLCSSEWNKIHQKTNQRRCTESICLTQHNETELNDNKHVTSNRQKKGKAEQQPPTAYLKLEEASESLNQHRGSSFCLHLWQTRSVLAEKKASINSNEKKQTFNTVGVENKRTTKKNVDTAWGSSSDTSPRGGKREVLSYK